MIQRPQFSFVTVFGTAKLYPYNQKEVLKWATQIAERYMGKRNAEIMVGEIVGKVQYWYELLLRR
jgi:hypothetical protein